MADRFDIGERLNFYLVLCQKARTSSGLTLSGKRLVVKCTQLIAAPERELSVDPSKNILGMRFSNCSKLAAF